ncbi:hypothetical protein NECAME_18543, partial [Necator americanus]
AELEEQINFLRERNVEESAIRFVQKMRSVSQLGKTAPEEHHGAGTKTINMFSKLLSHSSRFVMEGVKNLVPKKHNLPLTMRSEYVNDKSCKYVRRLCFVFVFMFRAGW